MDKAGAGEQELREALGRWRGQRARAHRTDGVDDAPGCVFGVMVGDRLSSIEGDLEEIRKEIAWVRNIMVGAVLSAGVATVLRFMGWAP